MCTPSYRNVLACLAVGAIGALPQAAAQSYEVIPRTVNLGEMGLYTNYLCRTDFTNFVFAPPEGWTYSVRAADRSLNLLSRGGNASLTIKLIEGDKGKVPHFRLEALRRQIQERLPAAQIVLEFTRPTSAGIAQVFNLEYLSANQKPMVTQLAFLALNGGQAEFTFTLPQNAFEKQKRTLAYVLQSFSLERNEPRK